MVHVLRNIQRRKRNITCARHSESYRGGVGEALRGTGRLGTAYVIQALNYGQQGGLLQLKGLQVTGVLPGKPNLYDTVTMACTRHWLNMSHTPSMAILKKSTPSNALQKNREVLPWRAEPAPWSQYGRA